MSELSRDEERFYENVKTVMQGINIIRILIN